MLNRKQANAVVKSGQFPCFACPCPVCVHRLKARCMNAQRAPRKVIPIRPSKPVQRAA
jgi:hypothetical protein